MFRYLVKRILVFIPTLFAISLIAFAISVNSPGDPIEALYGTNSRDENAGGNMGMRDPKKDTLRHHYGLDLPVFYFSFTNAASPDTLYKVHESGQRETLNRLIDQYGDWGEIAAWYRSLDELQKTANAIRVNDSLTETRQLLGDLQLRIISLHVTYEAVVIESKLESLRKNAASQKVFAPLAAPLERSTAAFDAVRSNSSKWKTWIPALHFYGYNQYHRWLFGDGNWLTGKNAKYTKGVVRGDFGSSYASKLPVTDTIGRAIPWSLFFTITSVLLAYLVSIPVGVQAAAKRGGFFDRSSSVVLFMLFSLPTFFMATLLLMTFANPSVLNIFEASGVKPVTGYPAGAGIWEKMRLSLPYIILPLICYTYSSLAFLSRTVRVSVLEISNLDFIRTARAKGLSKGEVNYKHSLRNALLPIITVFSNIFPAAVGGSVILEFIFGIPGMGQEIVNAIFTKDYPMIVCVFTLSGFMTLVGYLIADILYAIADPRITYSKK